MHFTVEQEDLKVALDAATRIAGSRKMLLPVLASVELDARDAFLTIRATDLSMGLETKTSAYITEPGACCVPAKLLRDYVSALPSGVLTMRIEDKRLVVTMEPQFEAKLHTMPTEEFPALPTAEDGELLAEIAAEDLHEALGQVLYAASGEDHRPAMTGVYWEMEGNTLTLTAADGFRLATRAMEADIRVEDAVIIHGAAMAEVLRLEGGIISLYRTETGNHLLFSAATASLSCGILEAKYPDYDAIIPKNAECRMVVDRRGLLKAVRVAGRFAVEGANIVRLWADKPMEEGMSTTLHIKGESVEVGAAEVEIDADATGDVQVAFNSRYLADVLGSMPGERVAIETTGRDHPGKFEPVDEAVDLTAVVMPMQLERW